MKPTSRRIILLIAAASLVCAGVPTLSAAASAEHNDGQLIRLSAEDLEFSREIEPASRHATSQVVTDYIEQQSRAGRGLDLANVIVASKKLPIGRVGVVFEAGDQIDQILVRLADGQDHHALGLGALMKSSGGSAATTAKAGMDAGRPSHARLEGRACRSLFFDAAYSSADHYIYDCWEKFQSSSRPSDWFYNRYTLFNPANSGEYGYNIVDATIRFRPWRGTSASIRGGPYSYAPRPSSNRDCASYSASISAGIASISLPLVACGSSIEPLPRGDLHSMGTDWDGRTTNTLELDSAATFSARSEPTFADYVWQTVDWCLGNKCANRDNESWHDTGW